MAVTTTTRLGLTRWSAGTDPFTRAQLDGNMAALEAKVVAFEHGTMANRPAAGQAGRLYRVSDPANQYVNRLWYDNGSAWEAIAPDLDNLALAHSGGREKVAALSATAGTAEANLANASVFTITPTGNWTLSFVNVPGGGRAVTLTFIISSGATTYTPTWPAGTIWLTQAPALVANKRTVVTLMTVDGATWIGSAATQA